MNIVIDKRFNGVSVGLIGPFSDPELAYRWIDREARIPHNELGIDRYVRESTEYNLRMLRSA